MLSDNERLRISRQLRLPGLSLEVQERLNRARILVIGAGGLGCPALQSLAATGVGHIRLVDDDVVDLSNIQRQVLFGASDVGQPKVRVAARRLEELQPGIEVEQVHERLTLHNALELSRSCDLIFDGSDTFATGYLAADLSEVTGIPLIWGTVLRFAGQFSVFDSTVGLRDLFPTQPPADSVPSCADAGVLGATTAVIGNFMSTDAIKLLTGVGTTTPGRVGSYDALSGTVHYVRVSADPDRARVVRLASSYGDPYEFSDSAGEVLQALIHGTVIDVREADEVAARPVTGAVNPVVYLPKSEWSTMEVTRILAEVPTETALVVCASGVRSAEFIDAFGAKTQLRLIDAPGGVKGLPTP